MIESEKVVGLFRSNWTVKRACRSRINCVSVEGWKRDLSFSRRRYPSLSSASVRRCWTSGEIRRVIRSAASSCFAFELAVPLQAVCVCVQSFFGRNSARILIS